MSSEKHIKAVALISGGLDSVLAAKMVIDMGIEVIPLHVRLPYLPRERDRSGARGRMNACLEKWAGRAVCGIDAGEEAVEILKSPKYGFGANMNPCVDCRILMLKKGAEFMRRSGADFIITGEVVGQRGMSQRRQALETADSESGLSGLILRPLSGLLMPETTPEKNGWIAREKMLGLNGRSRQPQLRLAESLGIEEPVNAAGGCLLTDPIFSVRLRDLSAHEGVDVEGLELLKIGRHFRLSRQARLIVGRDEKENNLLPAFSQPGDVLFYTIDIAGPAGLGKGIFDPGLLSLAGSFIAYYCRPAPGSSVRMICKEYPDGTAREFLSPPAEEKLLESFRAGAKNNIKQD
jgi:tRNA U34 2-thiouridine synthase MnmA/TrmU